MAFDRQATGLTLTRICLGIFFISEGLSKLRWFADASILSGRFGEWMQTAGPASHWYLQRIAVPWAGYFARLVPLGELTSGAALLVGFWTPLFAFIAFFMALNFHLAAGTLFTFGFLTNGYGLPVLGSTLGLAIGGVRLPWSVRR